MEYRIKDYTIKGQRILLPKQTSIEDLRLIFNETQKKLICSTATKDNVTLVQREGGTLVEVPTSVCSLNSTDLLTIKCDYGDEGATEATLTSAKEEIIEAVENAKPEIDTSALASKNLEDFFGVVPDDSEEVITDEEITQELEDIFNTIFN